MAILTLWPLVAAFSPTGPWHASLGMRLSTPEARDLDSRFQSCLLHDWCRTVERLGESSSRSTESATTLEARIAQVNAVDRDRQAMAECMGLAVEQRLHVRGMCLLQPADIAPGQLLPLSAATLPRACLSLPSEAADAVTDYVNERAPSCDPAEQAT